MKIATRQKLGNTYLDVIIEEIDKTQLEHLKTDIKRATSSFFGIEKKEEDMLGSISISSLSDSRLGIRKQVTYYSNPFLYLFETKGTRSRLTSLEAEKESDPSVYRLRVTVSGSKAPRVNSLIYSHLDRYNLNSSVEVID